MKITSTVAASLEAVRGELAGTKLSASTLNLVVWIDDPQRRNWVLERAELLGEKHPSFTLILDRTGSAPGTTVTTPDRGEDLHLTVQGECVLVDVVGMAPGEIAEYAAALCPRGVPTELWWSSATSSARPVFEALLPHIDALVVDSGALRDAQTLVGLAHFQRTNPGIALRDLAWLRLRPWQEMIANFFDDPNLLGELYAMRSLTIASGSDAEALYLGAWLASRLEWTVRGRDVFVDRNGEEISFHRERSGEIRRVQHVILASGTSSYHGEVSEDDPRVVRVWSDGRHAREPRLFTLQAIDNASLLEAAILQTDTDELFATALSYAATLSGD